MWNRASIKRTLPVNGEFVVDANVWLNSRGMRTAKRQVTKDWRPNHCEILFRRWPAIVTHESYAKTEIFISWRVHVCVCVYELHRLWVTNTNFGSLNITIYDSCVSVVSFNRRNAIKAKKNANHFRMHLLYLSDTSRHIEFIPNTNNAWRENNSQKILQTKGFHYMYRVPTVGPNDRLTIIRWQTRGFRQLPIPRKIDQAARYSLSVDSNASRKLALPVPKKNFDFYPIYFSFLSTCKHIWYFQLFIHISNMIFGTKVSGAGRAEQFIFLATSFL